MLSRLVHLLIDPLFIFTVLLFFTLTFLYRKKQGLFNGFMTATVIWFLFISTPLIPNLLIHSLESQYVPLDQDEIEYLQSPVEILVLGGGHSNDPRLPANSRLSQQAMMRLAEGIRVHNIIPGSQLILSGYSSSASRSNAENMALAAKSLGVVGDNMVLHEDPSDTWEESLAYTERVRRLSVQNDHVNTLIVVTSAAHMPRAVKMLEHHLTSVNIIASPTDFRYKSDGESIFNIRGFFPDVDNISKMKSAMKEYTALAEYYLLLR
jgi:uncharacterized SAM-binding protein YcdF (DUF218 family)